MQYRHAIQEGREKFVTFTTLGYLVSSVHVHLFQKGRLRRKGVLLRHHLGRGASTGAGEGGRAPQLGRGEGQPAGHAPAHATAPPPQAARPWLRPGAGAGTYTTAAPGG